jgi:hypothetical protein
VLLPPLPLPAPFHPPPPHPHLQPLVLHLHHYIECTLSKYQTEDDPPQDFLRRTRLILHVVSEGWEEGRDEEDAALIEELQPVLLGLFEGPPEAQVDELDHAGKVEEEDLDHRAAVDEEHREHEDEAADHIEGRK